MSPIDFLALRWLLAAGGLDPVRAARAPRTALPAGSEVKVGRGSLWAAPLVAGAAPSGVGDPTDRRSVPARRALEVGLVNHVVQGPDLRDHTQSVAERIARNAPLSVRVSKQTDYLSAQHPRDAAYALAEEIWEPVYRSADAQEGPAAFRDKRPPVWKGC